MKIFSLNWFKSKASKEMEQLRLKEQELQNKILEQRLKWEIEPAPKLITKPYQRLKLVNNILTIILSDGSVLTKKDATEQDFVAVRNAKDEATILAYITNHSEYEEIRKKDEIVDVREISYAVSIFSKHPEEFIIEGDAVYMKGIENRSIPALLLSAFADAITKANFREPFNKPTESVEFMSLKKFWIKCCLNPNAQSAEDLYAFLKTHNMKIDRHGNFYAYRRVVSLNTEVDKNLVEAISNAYSKVKSVWKKNPYDFFLYQKDEDGTFFISKHNDEDGTCHGNLKDLYLNLPDMQINRYTDAHTYTMDYRVGEIASIPRDKGDDNNQINCSRGLHAASKNYDYSGFGDTPILMIINPMDVLAAPLNETAKLRVCRWFFAMTLSEEEKYILDEEGFDVTYLGDVFEEKCLKGLTNHVQQSFAEEVKRHTFNIPTLGATELSSMVGMLEQLHDKIKDRVKKV